MAEKRPYMQCDSASGLETEPAELCGTNPPKKQCVRRANDVEVAEPAEVSGTSIAETNKKVIVTSMMLLYSSSSEEEDEEEDSEEDADEDDEDIIISVLLKRSSANAFGIKPFLLTPRKRMSVKNYMAEVVPNYSEKEFRTHFRLSRQLSENLSQRFSEWEMFRKMRWDKKLPASANILVFLWFAGHEACSFRDVSDRFNISLFTVGAIIERVSLFLSSLSTEFIRWPTEQKKEISSTFFGDKCSFPRAIGCIDGTHVVIDPPASSKDDYIDRKGNVTICVQGICDENRKFINMFVGYPGSCHDSWVLKNSPIYEKLPSYCKDYYLLGDSAYPCNKYLVTPYKDNGHLTRAQRQFNAKLGCGRVRIEHTFGILKQRFRQLYYCKLRGIKKICHFIRACCVLHNLANEDDLNFTSEISVDVEEEVPNHDEVSRGNSVRDEICQAMQNQTNNN